MVKRLRHHPFTVVSWVRIPLASFIKLKRFFMSQKTAKKVATVIAVILIAAMVLGAFLPYFNNVG